MKKRTGRSERNRNGKKDPISFSSPHLLTPVPVLILKEKENEEHALSSFACLFSFLSFNNKCQETRAEGRSQGAEGAKHKDGKGGKVKKDEGMHEFNKGK